MGKRDPAPINIVSKIWMSAAGNSTSSESMFKLDFRKVICIKHILTVIYFRDAVELIRYPITAWFKKRRSAVSQPVVTCAGRYGTDHGLFPGALMYVKRINVHVQSKRWDSWHTRYDADGSLGCNDGKHQDPCHLMIQLYYGRMYAILVKSFRWKRLLSFKHIKYSSTELLCNQR